MLIENGVLKAVFDEDLDEAGRLVIPNGVWRISVNSISAVKDKVQYVNFPETIKVIDDYTFTDCTKLRSIVISGVSRMEDIGKCAFKNCSSAEVITIPVTNKTLMSDTFAGCKGVKKAFITGYVDSAKSVARVARVLVDCCPNLTELYIDMYEKDVWGLLSYQRPESFKCLPTRLYNDKRFVNGLITNMERRFERDTGRRSVAKGLVNNILDEKSKIEFEKQMNGNGVVNNNQNKQNKSNKSTKTSSGTQLSLFD